MPFLEDGRSFYLVLIQTIKERAPQRVHLYGILISLFILEQEQTYLQEGLC